MKIEIVDRIHSTYEDGDNARIAELAEIGTDIFVRVHSWDEARQHYTMEQLEGRRVKVTIEILEEEHGD